MKKILSLLMIAAIVLSLCGCAASGGESAGKQDGGFRIGYARENITPEDPVPLGGYGNSTKRMSTGYLDYLYVTCVAITDAQDNTIMLISQDVIRSDQYKAVRAEVKKATGLSEGDIMVASTHTHSSPETKSKSSGTSAWDALYKAAIGKAAAAAMEDRSPAEISVGKKVVEDMNFVRHYLMSDGSYAGSNFGTFANLTIVDHSEPNDPGLQVIRFTRVAEDKQDIIMCNWQAHPCFTGGSTETVISADFIGSTRTYVEEQTGELFVYFTGAAGNQNAVSKIEGEAPTRDWLQYGQELGDHIIDVLGNMTSVASGDIHNEEYFFDAKVNHQWENNIEQAREVVALFNATDRTTGNKLAREYGFNSVYHCNGVISRASFGETYGFEINVLTMGELSFVFAPYEMFSTHSNYIKENTPYDMTFIVTCANGANGYIPSKLAHEYGCYERDIGRYTAETGLELAEKYVSILTEHKG